MELDVTKIYHQYITKMVIFSIFLFKRQIKQPSIYKLSIDTFLKKRVPWKINLEININKVEKDKRRNIVLDEILEDIETNLLSEINISFVTPLKKVEMNINLHEQDKYQKFFYS